MSRFVRPQTRTLRLENGDRLIVRERLTAGELRAMFARVYTPGSGGRLEATPFMSGVGTVLAYLLDWDLTDDAGAPVVIRDLSTADLQQVIDSLDQESFLEIKTAIESHVVAMAELREQEKKTAGEKLSLVT